MPKQHKAATDVTVVREEKSELAAWFESYWKPLVALAVVVAAGVLVFQYLTERRREALGTSWDRIWAHVEPGQFVAGFGGDAQALGEVMPHVSGTEAEPWALYLQAKVAADQRDYDLALAAIRRLQESHPNHPLVRERYPLEGRETPASLAERLAEGLRGLAEWEAGREHLFRNPAPPPDSPRVVLETTEGAIHLAIFSQSAPQHSDNFLRLVREGFYDGTRFHRVERDPMERPFTILGGDPQTRDEDRSLWGVGGPGYELDHEPSGLRNFAGYLGAAKPQGGEQSSGSQFYITVEAAHHLDETHVVFAKVVDGMEAVRRIAAGRLDPNPLRRGQPLAPATILSARVL